MFFGFSHGFSIELHGVGVVSVWCCRCYRCYLSFTKKYSSFHNLKCWFNTKKYLVQSEIQAFVSAIQIQHEVQGWRFWCDDWPVEDDLTRSQLEALLKVSSAAQFGSGKFRNGWILWAGSHLVVRPAVIMHSSRTNWLVCFRCRGIRFCGYLD